MLKSLTDTIGHKARNVGQGISSGISSAVAEIQKDLRIESRKNGGEKFGVDFDEAEVYKQMLVSFQVEQAKLGKTVESEMREKQDEAAHWKKLYVQATGGDEAISGEGTSGEGKGEAAQVAGGALGVDENVKLRGEVEVLRKVMADWELKLQESLERSTEEAALRMRLEHENAALNSKIKELDTARAASEDLIISLSAEKTRMLGSSGEASETIDDLVDEYSRLASEHTAQRQMDAETIQRLENVRDELVEKLKAHERNILQLLQRNETESAMSQEMGERSVVEQGNSSQAPGEGEEAVSRFSGGESGKTWTSDEVQAKLDVLAAELRAEKESALAELRQLMTVEKIETVKVESEAALILAAKGHAAAMKKAMDSASSATARAAREGQEALEAAQDTAKREREKALKELSKEKEVEKKESISKALEDAKEEWTNHSDSARAELEKLLKKEMEEKVKAVRKEMERELEVAKVAREETNALYAKENRSRKAIHNKLMELQGNIRVFARVRPMVEVEKASGKNVDVTGFPTDEDIIIKKAKENKKGKEETTETRFEFDRVFCPNSTQETVFEAVEPLVTSVLDGYNVCIFAYGQTGSGKTFTMEGPDSNPGVNTRALTNLFRIGKERSADVKYTFLMSMMEIYNEAVYDLLGADKDSKKSLEIRQKAGGGTGVPGVEEVEVSAMSEVVAQLARGGRNRAVGAHDMNEHSSRSHMIFNVRVEGKNVHTGEVVRAKLNLIDLAGSERISKTDATGERLREAQNINRSLSALGDVISSLSQAKGHVPFRNSKLTFLLQDALSGNSKVMMFVNASPASYNVTETICSLNFAARCRSVKLGAASKNVESAEVTKYRRASEALHAQLVAAGITPSVGVSGASPSASPSKTVGSRSGTTPPTSSSGRTGSR